MIIIFLGKPLVFWFGILTFTSLLIQFYLGIKMVKGHPELLKAHKLNAMVLGTIVIVHLVLGLLMYL